MSKENSKVPNYKQSFKAVENFLRRVAYNLGNSPSQTDVKIVSCIPIDVTDLQQRIFQLQNELADLKNAKNNLTKPEICSTCAKRFENNPKQVYCNECLLSTTSILSVYCPSQNTITNLKSSPVNPILNSQRAENIANTEKLNKSFFFSKKKKKSINKNLKTQLIFHAHATTLTPFRNSTLQDNYDKTEVLSHAYLADVVQRQYRHLPFVNDSNQSDISSPICRDSTPFYWQHPRYTESDNCSCCHGQFQNIDNYMNNINKLSIYPTCENTRNYCRNSYYDSNLYDIFPVKEKVIKNRNNIESQKRNEEKKKPTIKCWPGKTRPKCRTTPTVVNYCALSQDHNKKLSTHVLNQKDVVMNRMAAKRFKPCTPRRIEQSIDCITVYAKQERECMNPTIAPVHKQTQNVATNFPATDNITKRQTVATITENAAPEDKTEETLNQIKNILQTVLTEVKTSSKYGMTSAKSKKDAVVQNGPAQAFRGCEFGASELLQSYTYSPFNINPYNMNPRKPSCSHPISSNNYMYPEYSAIPGMRFQQYPLLIQQPQKHLCTNYYGNNNPNKTAAKRAASAATNTEQVHEHSKETERLIKEIYKSITLNMEESSKDNSVLEYMKTKAIADKYVNLVKTESDTESERIAKAISEIFKNSDLPDSTATTASTLISYLDRKKSVKVLREPVKKEPSIGRAQRNYSQRERSKYAEQPKTERKTHHRYREERRDSTIVNEITEESSSATESDEAVEIKKEDRNVNSVETVKAIEPNMAAETRKEKSGIFKKMLKIFQARPRRRRGDSTTNESQKESESDSDDYQTVYSQTICAPKPKKVAPVKSRAHSKVFYSKQPQHWPRNRSPEKHRTSPYMEQEYRRHWDENERLMFDHQQKRHSANLTRGTGDKSCKTTHAYYQNYEARPVLVDPIRRVPLRMPGNYSSKPRQAPIRSQYARHGENYDERNPKLSRCNMNTRYTSQVKPHFIASKSNVKRKSIFSKRWMNKTKLHCGQCGEEWKDLILNG